MALFVVEKQAVYLRVGKRNMPHASGAYEQEHLFVITRRVPWRNNPAQRTIGFVDASTFGGIDSPGNIRSFNKLRDTLVGNAKNPKLIVANISPSQIHVKQDLLGKLVSQYNLKHQTSYKPHYSHWKEINSVWMTIDPTRPGRVKIPFNTGFKAAQSVMGMPVVKHHKKFIQEEEDFKSLMAAYRTEPRKEVGAKPSKASFKQSNPKKYKDALLYIGMVFVIRFWPTRRPIDLYWSEGVQRRVRAHLAKTMTPATKLRPISRVRGMMEWYVMGVKDAPSVSARFKETPRGRINVPYTYRTGTGFIPLTTDKKTTLKPLFMVKGQNVDAARLAAQRKFDRMISNSATADKGYDLESQWNESGRKVISRTALQKYREG